MSSAVGESNSTYTNVSEFVSGEFQMTYYPSGVQHHLRNMAIRTELQDINETYHSVGIHNSVEAMSDNKDSRIGRQLIS